MVEKAKWDKKLGLGREKIFEVRKIYNDVTFIESFLTPEFCARHKLFSREFNIIKEKLLFHLTNFGQPFIEVVDANYDNRAELLLKHVHHGIDLDLDYAKDVLKNMYDIWKRPVLIETQLGSQLRICSFDGEKHKEMDTKEGI